MSECVVSSEDIQRGLDSYFAFLNEESSSPLYMDMHISFDSHQGNTTLSIDVNAFIGNKEKSFLAGEHAFFSRCQHPPPSSQPDKEKAYTAFQPL